MRFKIWYFEKEHVAAGFKDMIFVINLIETDCQYENFEKKISIYTSKSSPREGIYPFSPGFEKVEDDIYIKHFDEELSVKFYTNSVEEAAVLIRYGKFRIFYANSRYIKEATSLDPVISDIKKFFARKVDFAFLPLGRDTDRVSYFLSTVKPKYLVPLLPNDNPGIIEDFVKDYQFVRTSVLLYSGRCEEFEFNLI